VSDLIRGWGLALREPTTLVLASHVVTVTQGYHVLEAESGTTDTLETIQNGIEGFLKNGHYYYPAVCLIATAGHTITLTHGTDNIDLPNDTDVDVTDEAFTWVRYDGTNWRIEKQVSAKNVGVNHITGATYTNLQNVINLALSAGWVSGGALTDNADGTVDIAVGTGFIRSSDSGDAALYLFDWAATPGIDVSSGDSTYIYLDYNSGSPIVSTTATGSDITNNEHDKFELYEVIWDGAKLHTTSHKQIAVDPVALIQQRIYDINQIERAYGLILGELGTRNISLSTGRAWIKLDTVDLSVAIDTSSGDTFSRFYQDGVGGWTEQTGQTQWDNTHYDDGSGVLATLNNNKYCNQYFYFEADGDLACLFGQAEYNTLADAEKELPPSTVPLRLQEHALLVGRVVFQKSGATAQDVQSAFTNVFAINGGGGGVTDHGALTGLYPDDDHPQYPLLTGRSGGQTLIGGTDSGDDLHFKSTSDATKGNIVFDDFATTASGFLRHAGGYIANARLEVDNASAPTSGDDINDGFLTGSVWIRLSGGVRSLYMASYVVAGAAIWPKIDNWYTPTTGSDWPDPDPTTYDEGLDDLADRVTTLEGSSSAQLWRSGLELSKYDASTIAVEPGEIHVDGSLLHPTTVTQLALGTAGNWISGSVDEAASIPISVYIDNAGNIKLHNHLPGGSSAIYAQVNQAGWNGTAGNGLDATSVTVDNSSGTASITAGQYAIIYTDSGYTTGRGKGSAGTSSVAHLSYARVVSYAAGTLTLQTGHNIALNDNDYILIVDGFQDTRTVSTTVWRWLGALWNDASSDLTTDTDYRAQSELDEASNYTTTSTSFTAIDTTDLSRAVVSDGRPLHARFYASLSYGNVNQFINFNLQIDGVTYVADDGLAGIRAVTSGTAEINQALVERTIPVLPGTHTVAVLWKTNTSTATMYAGAGTANLDHHPQFLLELS
jgi:hypothetical protein